MLEGRRVGCRWCKFVLVPLLCLTLVHPTSALKLKMAKQKVIRGGVAKKPTKTKVAKVRRQRTPAAVPHKLTHRATVTDEDGVRFEGWFNAEGELHGRGTMHFPDGGWQTCSWEVRGVAVPCARTSNCTSLHLYSFLNTSKFRPFHNNSTILHLYISIAHAQMFLYL